MMRTATRHDHLDPRPIAGLTIAFSRCLRVDPGRLEQAFTAEALGAWCGPAVRVGDTPLALEEATVLGPVRMVVRVDALGALTRLTLTARFGDPVVREAHLGQGYTDLWEERLYRLADALEPHNTR